MWYPVNSLLLSFTGWTPSTFVSSRSNKNEGKKNQIAEDFMDDEASIFCSPSWCTILSSLTKKSYKYPESPLNQIVAEIIYEAIVLLIIMSLTKNHTNTRQIELYFVDDGATILCSLSWLSLSMFKPLTDTIQAPQSIESSSLCI